MFTYLTCPFCERTFRADEPGMFYNVYSGKSYHVCAECRAEYCLGKFEDRIKRDYMKDKIFKKETVTCG